MNNSRISKKEWGLIKGALRRVFSRSDLRRSVIEAAIIDHNDPSRPKVKTWCICAICKLPEAKSYMVVDHILPVVPVDRSLEDMTPTELVDHLWCDKSNLQCCDLTCHKIKSKVENKERRLAKKEKGKNEK